MSSRYGLPTWPPDPWPTVTVGYGDAPFSKTPEREVPMPEGLARQRWWISVLGYLGPPLPPPRPTVHPPEREPFDPHAKGKAARARARAEISESKSQYQDQAR